MKKYSILMILTASILTFSCGSDDEDSSVKCLECAGADKVCVGDAIDPNDSSQGTYDEETLQELANFANAFSDGTCTFE